MTGVLIRVVIAVIAVVLIYALMPPVFRVIGIDLNADVMKILGICIGALALIYIWRGRGPNWFPPAAP